MTDTVAIALITGLTTAVTTIANVIVTIATRRDVKRTRRDVGDLRREMNDEAAITRAYSEAYLELVARHPDDLPSLRLPTRDRNKSV